MRFYAKSALVLLLALVPSIPAATAQQTQFEPYYHPNREQSNRLRGEVEPRPLSLDEGLAVIGAALDSRHHRGFATDCSHFVHGLYQRAGFPYPYAPSTDLYAGVDEFQRVTTPQAGDLAVWRGHVGIVVNPAQHSFFSLLRSGPGVEKYDSPYWKRRGRPHFFRYVRPDRAVQNASLRPTSRDDADSPEANSLDANSHEANYPDDPGSNPVKQPPLSGAHASSRGHMQNAPLEPVIHSVRVNSVHPRPSEVGTAFLQACADSGDSLRGRDLFKSTETLVVFDHFAVRKVHISGSQNWAEVQIDEVASISGAKAETQKRTERQRWPLVHGALSTWELTLPRDTVYLPQSIAARLTAQQLDELTTNAPGSTARTRKTELAQLLNVLQQE